LLPPNRVIDSSNAAVNVYALEEIMARITGVSPETRNPLLRVLFWLVRRRFGRPVAPLLGYARSGAVLASMMALEAGMERARRLDPRLSKLAELRVAALVGCPFCLDIGSALVAKLGVPPAQLRELNVYDTSNAFSDLERLVLRYADHMTQTPVYVDDAEVQALRAHLNEAQLVELTAAIAHENLRARLNHALGYGAQGFSTGVTCALPATPQPAAAAIVTDAH
jgi:AhpD family alkylhydroperoxidase